MRLVHKGAAAVVALAAMFAPALAAEPASGAPSGRLGRTTIVVAPEEFAELVAQGVEVSAVGRGTALPYRDTVKVTLPVTSATESEVELGGGIRFAADDATLTVRDLTIPFSGLVSGTVRGSEIGAARPAVLYFQAPSDSTLGDTALRFTFTFASYVNTSFGTGFTELELFGYSTTRIR